MGGYGVCPRVQDQARKASGGDRRVRMKSLLGTVVALGALLASPSALAEDAKTTAPATEPSKVAPAGESAGRAAPRMVVTIDRETGRLRPATAEERAALAAAGGRQVLARTGEATQVETRADGSKRARLGPEFFKWAVARVKADGTVRYDCVPAGKAGAAMKAPASGTSAAAAAQAAPEK
jgi:hypothetical protein